MNIKLLFLVIFCLFIQACSSVPIAKKLTDEQQNAISTQENVTASLVCNQPEDYYDKDACEYASIEMEELLSKTGWFSSLKSSPEDADIIISFEPPYRKPYYTSPGHNPAFALLSIAIPFWWSENFGYKFEVSCKHCPADTAINTERTGTVIMWGFSPLINISPNRALFDDGNRELQHLKLQLLPVVQMIKNHK